MKIIKKFNALVIILVLLISFSTPVKAVDTILGVPISKFDNINNFENLLNDSIVNLKTYGGEQYKLRYKINSYGYAYYILQLAEMLGAETSAVYEHVLTYNSSIMEPLTSEDTIKTNGVEEHYIITSSSQDFLDKIMGVVGVVDDTLAEESNTIFGLLGGLRIDAGLAPEMGTNQSWEDSTLSTEDLSNFVSDNISKIRIILTVTKDLMTDFRVVLDETTLNALEKYFIETYDLFVNYAMEKEVVGLKDIDLFGEGADKGFNPNEEDAKEHIAKWVPDIEEPSIDSLSEYMLKGIAASSTFEPFKTNLNSTSAFEFVGPQMQLFHEAYGSKRKFILTPIDTYSNVNQAMDMKENKKLKIMTLRAFVEKQGKDKILYIDNMDYDISEVKSTQEALSKDNVEETAASGSDVSESSEENSIDDVVENTAVDKASGWKANVKRISESVTNTLNKSMLTDWLITGATEIGLTSQEDKVSSIIFAKSDNVFTKKLVNKVVKEERDRLAYSSLLYTNIMEEYYNKTLTSFNFKADMDKPMYVDIYGNILTASGIVVIPAMSNYYYFKKKVGIHTFTRAFIESYPEYRIKDGLITVDLNDKYKKVFAMFPDTNGDAEDNGILDLNGEVPTDVEVVEQLDDPLAVTTDATEVKKDSPSDSDKITTFSTNLEGEVTGGKPVDKVKFYVANVGKEHKMTRMAIVNGLNLTTEKFDSDYELEKSLDVFSFPQKRFSKLESYDGLYDAILKLSPKERVAVINDFTVKLKVSEESPSEVISFKSLPNHDEVKKFMYISALAELIRVKDGEIEDKGSVSLAMQDVVKQVYVNGVYGLDQVNNRLGDAINSFYEDYEQWLVDKSNNRYQNYMGSNANNNLLYNAPLEETNGMKVIIPVMYKIILIIAILSIIFIIIMSVMVKENKLKQVIKVFTAVYLIMMLIQIGPWVFDNTVNRPLSWLMNNELVRWTVVEQENNANRVKITGDKTSVTTDIDSGSEIRLYRLDYTYPFKLMGASSNSGLSTVDEYYASFVDSNYFEGQNNKMWIDGRYVVTDTETLFSSSSIVSSNDENDILKKLKHEVYNNPEISYYMPYYMFLDNITYNLNLVSSLTKKVPKDIRYNDGTMTTTGRIKDYMGSALFLDYDEFSRRIDEYVGGDEVDTDLAREEVKSLVEQYGESEDFLGVSKILKTNNAEEIDNGDGTIKVEVEASEPFTSEELESIRYTAWYPHLNFDEMTFNDKEKLQEDVEQLNKKVKRFILSLYDVSDSVSDETLIKTIALYASFEFNKTFGEYASNSYLPTGLSTKGVSMERIMIAMSVPKEEMLDVSIKSYPLVIMDKVGYFGLLLSTANDYLILLINYIKPAMSVLVWTITAIVIFSRKILLPTKDNDSIMGSLKVLVYYSVSSLMYGVSLWLVIRMIDWGVVIWMCHIMVLIFSLAYLFTLVTLAVALLRDTSNLGSAYIMKGTGKTVGLLKATVRGVADSTAIGRQLMYGNARKRDGTIRMMDKLDGKLGVGLDEQTKSLIRTSGSVSLYKSVSYSADTIRKGAHTGKRITSQSLKTAKKVATGISPKATANKVIESIVSRGVGRNDGVGDNSNQDHESNNGNNEPQNNGANTVQNLVRGSNESSESVNSSTVYSSSQRRGTDTQGSGSNDRPFVPSNSNSNNNETQGSNRR